LRVDCGFSLIQAKLACTPTMTSRLAYHVVVHALEARAGWTPVRRFAAAVAHSLNGHLPYTRYLSAGVQGQRRQASESTVQRWVEDWLATDVNPVIQTMGQLMLPANTAWALNAYTRSAQVGVRTTIALPDAATQRLQVRRELLASNTNDPALCRAGVVSTMETLLAHTLHHAQRGTRADFRPLSGLASLLGVEQLAAAQLAAVFEAQGPLPIPLAARQLGCHQRTLERRLREEGLTAEAVRQTVRLLAAAQALRGPRSLTEIAHHCGFADLSHMSRAFGVACGMAPSLLRQAAQGGLRPEPA
jgi:AraC-like DNA-binding protein